jgi:hypothetical protein
MQRCVNIMSRTGEQDAHGKRTRRPALYLRRVVLREASSTMWICDRFCPGTLRIDLCGRNLWVIARLAQAEAAQARRRAA